MRQFCAIIFTIFFFFVFSSLNGQVVTITNPANTTPNLAPTYTSLSAAITALNSRTAISGPVAITLNAGNPQTAPAGGYIIQFATLNNTAASPITITGSGNTVTAFTPQTAAVLYDGIFKIIGADYITLQDFVLQENALNTTTAAGSNNMTEWGVALLYKSTSDGAQNNVIQNNTIALRRTYQNSFGIYSNVRHSATAVNVTADVINNTTGPNKNNRVYNNTVSDVNMGISFIGVSTAANMDTGNDIGGTSSATGNSLTNWGGATASISVYISNSGTFHGIFTNHQVGANISYNIVSSATISGTTTSLRGIHNRYASGVPTGSFTTTISNNTITLINNNASGTFEGILSEQLANTSAIVSITDNILLNNSSATLAFTGISNTSVCGVINISNNIFRGNTSAATSAGFTAINQSAAVVTAININNNIIGDAAGNAISFSAATSGSINGISCSGAGTGASVSISNNGFRGFVQSLTGSGSHRYIFLTHAPGSAVTDNINGNYFTNISANTTNNVTFIQRSGAMAQDASATENCIGNSIITGFSKPVAQGIVSLYLTGSTCLSGNTMNATGNNFSNITLTGSTTMAGWDNEEGATSGPTKNINGNTFTNWNCGSGAVNVIKSDFAGANTNISGNTIGNISGTGNIFGIIYGAGSKLQHNISSNSISSLSAGGTAWGISGGTPNSGTVFISGNDIHSITSTGAISSMGIRIANALNVDIVRNKIYDINASNTSCVANGIEIISALTGGNILISNNLIGDIKAALTNNPLAVTGLKLSTVAGTVSSYRVYYNSIYLNATSAGVNFGTASIYVFASATANVGNTILRNNIFVNLSAPNGSGVAAAYMRSNINLNNYGNASNNNIFYAGAPSSTNLIFSDGTNRDQTLVAFKSRVTSRESGSFTELPPFLSLSGASAGFLHLDPDSPTQAESGAVNISGFTNDYDVEVRQGNAGYSGTGTAPDIGADETEAIFSESDPPMISAYTMLTTPVCAVTNRTITGVNITDATGIPLSGADRPRIYYRKNAAAWFSQPGTNSSGDPTNSTWNFTIVVSDMGSMVGGDVVSYYIIAQDLNPIVNVGSNPSAGLVAISVNSVSTHPTSPNTYQYNYNLSGTYTVGVGGQFPTLTAAVATYNNACSLAGPTVFELIDDAYGSETFPLTINFRADANSTNTLTIRPSATAVPVIAGVSNSAGAIISLDGARYITIDGRQGGVGGNKSMSLSNTGTAVTIQFINDAHNNNVRYCQISGRRVSSFSGTIAFLNASASGTGNDNNSIDNNDIFEAAGGFSNNGIYSAGTAGRDNSNNTVANNNIFNYFNAGNDSHGVFLNSNSTGWTITGNRLYQTATRVYTSANFHFGIYVTTGAGYTISNNIIGFGSALGTGLTNMIGNSVDLPGFPSGYMPSGTGVALRYIGIGLSLALAGPASTVDGNRVEQIAMYTSSSASTFSGMFCGIYVESGTVNIGAIAGNIIGTENSTGSIYVATSGAGGTILGIRTGCLGTVAIRNNSIGSISSSGTSAAISGSFTGISIAGVCNYTVSNNSIGYANPDNVLIGLLTSGGILSNAGTLTATNVGVTAMMRGIVSSSTGNTLAITNNSIRGWATSCRSSAITAVESSGAMFGAANINVNDNVLGTAATSWVNSEVDITAALYGINMSNTGAIITNIKGNEIQGAMLGTMNGAGGGFIRLSGATGNNLVTISGNRFTNLTLKLSSGAFYFIYTNYTISATGRLVIDDNRINGSFTGAGNASYNMISCLMGASGNARADITNNDFSNINITAGFTSSLYGIYTNFSSGSCLAIVNNNTFSNWSAGAGAITAIELSDMTGTATCSGNTISNIGNTGAIEGLSISSSAASGIFNVTNNNIRNLVSSGVGGFVDGIANYLPGSPTSTQINFNNNLIHSLSSSSAIGIVSGFHLYDGHASAAVNFNANKIYDLSESGTGGRVYGIYSQNTLAGDITYSNNLIGDLRAPAASVTGPAVVGIRLFMAAGQSKLYYNTIYLNIGPGIPTSFSSAAVYVDAATQVILRNNIFSNNSSHGTSGRTVAYWRTGASLTAYDASSNNNLFYARIPSAQDLIFYDGTNADQTLAGYQARVNPRDNFSVSALPVFLSTIGADVSFLHIPPTGSCATNARGNNSGILIATDFDNEVRSTTFPFVTDIGADEYSKKNVWTGANGTGWNNSLNWSEGTVPNTFDENAIISTPPSNQPVIAPGESFQVESLVIGSGATLTNRGTLKVAGSIYSGNASINNFQAGIVVGSLEMNGNCSINQPLSGSVFVANSLKNFTISNDVIVSPGSGEEISVFNELSFGAVTAKTLNTSDNLILVSNFTGTSNVGKISGGNIISGRATVERFINTGTGSGQHPKGWQFLATPARGQTIFQSWQENGATPAGYGTIITGTGSGFDLPTIQPSMKFFDPTIGANGNWNAVSNTSGLIEDSRGYMVFVRGDRTITTSSTLPNPTNLRIKGTLFQPNDPPPATNVLAGKFASVGNPYASAIDLVYLKDNGLFVNLDNDVVVWDPLLYGSFNYGGYQTLAAANNYEPTAGGTIYYPAGVPTPFIQSGQAFFVHSSGPAGTVAFNENCKESTDRLVNRLSPPEHSRQFFRVSLFTQESAIADGNAVVFDAGFSNEIDRDDARKLLNSGENFAIIRENKMLSVEARNVVQRTDTVFYQMSNLRKQAYQLRFSPKNMAFSGLRAYLIDRYLNRVTDLSLNDSSFVDFQINNDTLSNAGNRFYVLFRKERIVRDQTASISTHELQGKTLVETMATFNLPVVRVFPNPVENKTAHLEFVNQPAGNYQLHMFSTVGNLVFSNSIKVDEQFDKSFIRFDPSLASGSYFLHILSPNGNRTVLRIILK